MSRIRKNNSLTEKTLIMWNNIATECSRSTVMKPGIALHVITCQRQVHLPLSPRKIVLSNFLKSVEMHQMKVDWIGMPSSCQHDDNYIILSMSQHFLCGVHANASYSVRSVKLATTWHYMQLCFITIKQSLHMYTSHTTIQYTCRLVIRIFGTHVCW